MFKAFADEFSKASCTLSYQEVTEHLRELEANQPTKKDKVLGIFNAETQQEQPERKASVPDLQQLLAMFASAAQSQPGQPRGATKEVCRNYLAGVCKNGNCARIHPPGKEGSKPKPKSKKIKCYNCQQLSDHIAANCPNKRVERRAASQANHLTSDNMTLEDFLAHLVHQLTAKEPGKPIRNQWHARRQAR